MNRKSISDALNGIDAAYIEEAAESVPIRRRNWWKAVLPLAACLAIVLAVGQAPGSHEAGTDGALLPEAAEPPGLQGGMVGARPPENPDALPPPETAESPALNLLPGAVPGEGSWIELAPEDFVPMSRQELLDYYGIGLPIETVLPRLRPDDDPDAPLGIYRRNGGTGEVYTDHCSFSFSGEGQRLTVSLHKTAGPASPLPETFREPLRFTPVNGRELAIFAVPTGGGGPLLYTEWAQNGLSWHLSAVGLSGEEFVTALTALVESNGSPTSQSVTGTLSYGLTTVMEHGRPTQVLVTDLWIHPEDGPPLRIQTPDDLSPDALEGCTRAAVSWRGEPATIRTIWAGQLLDFTPLKGDTP